MCFKPPVAGGRFALRTAHPTVADAVESAVPSGQPCARPAVRFTELEAVGAADSIEATKVVTQAEPTTIGAKIPVV